MCLGLFPCPGAGARAGCGGQGQARCCVGGTDPEPSRREPPCSPPTEKTGTGARGAELCLGPRRARGGSRATCHSANENALGSPCDLGSVMHLKLLPKFFCTNTAQLMCPQSFMFHPTRDNFDYSGN